MITPLSFKGERMNIAVYCAASQSNCPAFDKKTEELGSGWLKITTRSFMVVEIRGSWESLRLP